MSPHSANLFMIDLVQKDSGDANEEKHFIKRDIYELIEHYRNWEVGLLFQEYID